MRWNGCGAVPVTVKRSYRPYRIQALPAALVNGHASNSTNTCPKFEPADPSEWRSDSYDTRPADRDRPQTVGLRLIGVGRARRKRASGRPAGALTDDT